MIGLGRDEKTFRVCAKYHPTDLVASCGQVNQYQAVIESYWDEYRKAIDFEEDYPDCGHPEPMRTSYFRFLDGGEASRKVLVDFFTTMRDSADPTPT